MNKEQSQTIRLLQVYRGLAALLVVVYHATLKLFDTYRITVFGGALSFGFSGVHLFFVLSGFIIAFIHHSDINKPSRLPGYAYKRFSRIYPIYWIVLTLYIPSYLTGLNGTINGYHLADNITLLRITQWDKIVEVAWTLSHEILFYVFFALLILHRRIGILFMYIWLILIGYNIVKGAPLSPSWTIAQWIHIDYNGLTNFSALVSNPLNLLFFLGILSYVLYEKLKHSPHAENIAIISLGIGLAIFVMSSLYWVNVTNTYINWGRMNLYYGVAYFCLMLVILSKNAEEWAAKRSFLILAGNASYSIYLLHYGCQTIIIRLIDKHLAVDHELTFIILTVIPTSIGIVCHLTVEAPILRRISISNRLVKNSRSQAIRDR